MSRVGFFFFFKQKTAYEMLRSLVGSEMCIRDRVNERINESTLRWFVHVERMNDSRLVKRMYSGECARNRPAGRPKKKWIESVMECLQERNVSLSQARRKVHDRREWRGFVRGYVCGPPGPGDEHYT